MQQFGYHFQTHASDEGRREEQRRKRTLIYSSQVYFKLPSGLKRTLLIYKSLGSSTGSGYPTCRSHPRSGATGSGLTIILDPGRYGQEPRILCLPAGAHGSIEIFSCQWEEGKLVNMTSIKFNIINRDT